MLCVLLVVLVPLGGLYIWLGGSINSGEEGIIKDEIKTAPEFKGDVANILVLGLDYEEGRSAKMTDMILYVNFDVKNNRFNMLQIPRDLFVGEGLSTGGTGKINALYHNAPDKSNPVGAIADVIHNQFQLPIDYYVTVDMDMLKNLINTFGGIEVYVPRDMEYKGSKLEKGMRNLDGDAAEFFVRNRHGAGFERSDIDRLEMQRYFYAGLFRKFRELTVKDAMMMIPYVATYINASVPMNECVGLGLKLLNVPSENIMMCRMPVYGAAENYGSNSIVVGAQAETAELLNTYFRAYTEPVPAESLNLAKWPTSGPVIEAAVQYMGEIEASEAP